MTTRSKLEMFATRGYHKPHASPRQKKSMRPASSACQQTKPTHLHTLLSMASAPLSDFCRRIGRLWKVRVYCSSEVVLARLCVLFQSVRLPGAARMGQRQQEPPLRACGGAAAFFPTEQVTGRDRNGLQAQTCALTTYRRALCAR